MLSTGPAAAPAITSELSAATTAVLGIIAVLFTVIAYFLRRELNANDAAHTELRGDVKKLLAGQGRIEGTLEILTGRRRDPTRRPGAAHQQTGGDR